MSARNTSEPRLADSKVGHTADAGSITRRGTLRAANVVISVAMTALFVVHGVGNVFQMTGVGTPLSDVLSWTLVALCVAHMGIGVLLTVDTFATQRRAGTSYPVRNLRFWVVRASGFAIALLLLAHVLIFVKPAGDVVRLNAFELPQLIWSILLVVSLAVHVLANVEPLIIDLGLPSPRDRTIDVTLVFSLILVLMVVGFVIYYLRWSAI